MDVNKAGITLVFLLVLCAECGGEGEQPSSGQFHLQPGVQCVFQH